MRIPLSWLQEYISLSLSPEKIAHLLTMAGLEVNHYKVIGEKLKDIVIVRVLQAHKHPNADKLIVANVTDGKQHYQIVCGAPNCRVGLKTALARIGTTLGEGDQIFTIKKAKIRGIESEGMLCSEQELGLSDHQEGIIELPDGLSEGASLYGIYADTYFDISLTPNLSHCTSVVGIARELAALTGQSLCLPQSDIQMHTDLAEASLTVQIIDSEDCPRYACRVIRNVKVGPSPDWLRQRLEKCGLRSINNVVDATNYVLLETGHPVHAFDYDKIEGQKLIIRKAKEGETIQTLDGKERSLKSTMLMICDKSKPIAVAGVMGGQIAKFKIKHIILY